MKVLFIGGTGMISTSVSRLAVAEGIELYLLNRGNNKQDIPEATHLEADIEKSDSIKHALGDLNFDVVVDWLAFEPQDIEHAINLFKNRTKQFIFISSASCYQKPVNHYKINESTPLANPYWDYSQNKIACEIRLMQAYRDEGFPATIVRPSLTYSKNFPIAIGGWGCYTLADRILNDQPIIVHGDGTSLWVVTHADDFAKGFVPLMGNPQAIGEAFHITSDEVLTWDQIYQTIATALGKKANIIHIPSDFIVNIKPEYEGTLLGDKSWSVVFDNSKIKRIVPEFNPVIPFHKGIQLTLDWFNEDNNRRFVNATVNASMDAIISAYQKR